MGNDINVEILTEKDNWLIFPSMKTVFKMKKYFKSYVYPYSYKSQMLEIWRYYHALNGCVYLEEKVRYECKNNTPERRFYDLDTDKTIFQEIKYLKS